MFKNTKAFSGFSVNNLDKAKEFYSNLLGIEVENGPMGLSLKVSGSNPIFIYQKDDHAPASFTILNFPVDNIDEAINELKEKGISLERYEGMTDNDGVMRGLSHNMGPDIAWFKDPSGNILSVLQSS